MVEIQNSNLQIFYRLNEGVSSKTGKPYRFYETYTIVNGIPIRLSPLHGDLTGSNLLSSYYDSLKGGIN